MPLKTAQMSVLLAVVMILAHGMAARKGTALAARISSVYTQIHFSKCRKIADHKIAAGQLMGASFRCRGYQGRGIFIHEEDLRLSITYRQDGVAQTSTRQTLPSFNTIWQDNKPAVMEWRALRHGNGQLVPFATILRYYTDKGTEDPGARGQILVITRLAPDDACHVGYVDALANKDANRLARRVADLMAPEFDCASGTARFYDWAMFGRD